MLLQNDAIVNIYTPRVKMDEDFTKFKYLNRQVDESRSISPTARRKQVLALAEHVTPGLRYARKYLAFRNPHEAERQGLVAHHNPDRRAP